MTPTPPGSDPTIRLFLQLCIQAHHTLRAGEPSDYWYRLGARNAFAAAAGHVLSATDPADTVTIAELITTALGNDVRDAAQLEAIVRQGPCQVPDLGAGLGAGPDLGAPAPSLEWVGPATFRALHGGSGIDQDFGTHWGPGGQVRISLRRAPGTDTGLLYAYDQLWDEYAVLADPVSGSVVRAAFHTALATDEHMDPREFTTFLHRSASPSPSIGFEL